MKSLSNDQKKKVQQLQDLVQNFNIEDVAIQILRKNNWDVNNAMEYYYDNGYDKQSKNDKPSKEMQQFIDRYINTKTQVIESDGILKLLEDLQLSEEDTSLLVFAYHCGAKKNGEFSRAEFEKGLNKLQINNLQQFKNIIPQFKIFLNTDQNYKEVYKFLFEFTKEVKHVKFDNAIYIWKVFLLPRFKIVAKWIDFLENLDKSKKNDISQDLWNMVLDFCLTIKDDISNYDPNNAWPYLIDEFVESLQNKK